MDKSTESDHRVVVTGVWGWGGQKSLMGGVSFVVMEVFWDDLEVTSVQSHEMYQMPLNSSL